MFNFKIYRAYLESSKLRVVALMIFTSFIGMLLANPLSLNFEVLILGNLGIALMSLSAGSINQLLDQRIDKIMQRTKKRPLVSGILSTKNVIIYASIMAILGFCILYFRINTLTAWLTLASLVGYAFIYTLYLKRSTPQNIVIGGAAGATPPLLGWTAMTGQIDLIAVVLFLIIFTWTPPHFWALALYRKEEYFAAKIPMLPVTHGEQYTRVHITLYTLMLTIVSFLPFIIKFSSSFYLAGATILNLIFLYYVIKMQLAKNNLLSNKIFNYSIVYLSALFGFLIADRYLVLLINIKSFL
ncbi:MAG: protoheme IX farnesyltransferase [Gammaproteobacteria bacterium]|jgi:heme o synthase|nr:protoheme IX farnesyltransferase [Gammaproteobacteria bacterium]MBT6755631.1 protoheme IX farnesyltransferase [Gammaproteobacteria bacterium]MBT7523884.1 protoheme IX farnesyltransferase [Gammaproteobacteria bacterium]MBT7815053.1 protoheme IX farnesyltransferase [Gammaproteobacteria bacterium]MDA9896656.1 heme o synthase [Gammaproteobacteria bacterium]